MYVDKMYVEYDSVLEKDRVVANELFRFLLYF